MKFKIQAGSKEASFSTLDIRDLVMLSKEYYVIEYRPVFGPKRFREKLREQLVYMFGLEKSGVLFLSGILFDQERE